MKNEVQPTDLEECVRSWINDWNDHNLHAVMALFHEDAVFIPWTGQCLKGKKSIQRAWARWFEKHGNFHFTIELIAVDKRQKIVTLQWQLAWPSPDPKYKNKKELRKGVDIIEFHNELIVSKKSFCQTLLSIDAEDVYLHL